VPSNVQSTDCGPSEVLSRICVSVDVQSTKCVPRDVSHINSFAKPTHPSIISPDNPRSCVYI